VSDIVKNVYRYDYFLVSTGDEEYGYHSEVRLNLSIYKIIKNTPCGVWIDNSPLPNKFINLKSKKQFACLTRSDAAKQFIKRKQVQKRILLSTIQDIDIALSLINGEGK
jgi:hypothetical protein